MNVVLTGAYMRPGLGLFLVKANSFRPARSVSNSKAYEGRYDDNRERANIILYSLNAVFNQKKDENSDQYYSECVAAKPEETVHALSSTRWILFGRVVRYFCHHTSY